MRWPVLSIAGFKLVAEVGVIVTPVTDGQLEKLPDSEDWFTLWLDILAHLPPAASCRFLQMHAPWQDFLHTPHSKNAKHF